MSGAADRPATASESYEGTEGASAAARRLGVSAERVRQLEREGQLKAQLTPLGRLFKVDDVEALARARRERGRAPG